ncbi:MAG TPA: hypothetical protein VF525_03765 [Pyrinomonadaceae bacterium]
MNDYFQGSVSQLVERGQRLLSTIPTSLPREFHRLEQICRGRVCDVIDKLRSLVEDPRILQPDLQPERLRRFRRAVRELDFLETVCIAALERALDADKHLNRVVERIRTEINYPLLPPIVTPLSQSYFKIYPDLNLLCVPLSEGNFLLHLPDIYHELAHPLLAEKYDPRVKPFQAALSRALDVALGYLEGELENEGRGLGPKQFSVSLYQWSNAWVGGWAIELFCDLFAVFTLGPAFVWSHLHLSAKRGSDPFHTLGHSSHPPDGARMTAMLYGLNLAGFTEEAEEIRRRWDELIAISAAQAGPEYDRCFPGYILESFAEESRKGVSEIGCRIASQETKDIVHGILSGAWVDFWHDPQGYAAREKGLVESLREQCSTT